MAKLKVGVIFGGRSGEHEVSLNSARSVMAVIDTEKYEIIQIGISQDGQWLTGENVLEALDRKALTSLTPAALLPNTGDLTLYTIRSEGETRSLEPVTRLDVVFPVLHGTYGEDGTLQGLLELTGIAYVGAGVLGSSVGMDKALFKDVMRGNNLPVLPSFTLTRRQVNSLTDQLLNRIESVAPYPLFTKPVNLGSSVGITKCWSRADLIEGLMDAARYDRRIIVERGLENPREIEVSVLGNEDPHASLPGEVIPCDDFYSYKAKYLDDRSSLIIPAQLSMEVILELRRMAIQVYQAADCSGMARVDFLIDRLDQSIYISEINTLPGFTNISMYPKLWEVSGLPYPVLIDRLIELALDRKADRDQTEHHYGRTA